MQTDRVCIYLESPRTSLKSLVMIKKILEIDTSVAQLKQISDDAPSLILDDIPFHRGKKFCDEVNSIEPCLSLRLKSDHSAMLLAEHIKCDSMEEFIGELKKHADESRIQSALKMLNKDTFQLFFDLSDDSLSGIVKSQTDPELFYACALNSRGRYSCCTQNLRVCGGLQGSVCKHILVLLIGLARTGLLEFSRGANWIVCSRRMIPMPDEEATTALFLKYKAADVGEVDWRPTETVPEDYYSF